MTPSALEVLLIFCVLVHEQGMGGPNINTIDAHIVDISMYDFFVVGSLLLC